MFPNLRLLLLRFFIVVQEISYPSCFIVYYEIIISLFRQSHSTPSSFRANSTSVRLRGFALCRYFRCNAKKLVGTTGESFSPWVGLYGIWIVSQITQNQVRLVGNTHIVLRTTQSRL